MFIRKESFHFGKRRTNYFYTDHKGLFVKRQIDLWSDF